MGKTVAQKIFDAHLIDKPTEGVNVLSLDRVFCHEITTPIAIDDLVAIGRDRVFDPARIKVVIDMHVGPGTKVNQLLSNALSWEPEMQQALVDVWREIAARYKGDPVLYGYDLLNEPREENYVYKPGGGLSWNRLADRIARAIREIDPKTPIVWRPFSRSMCPM